MKSKYEWKVIFKYIIAFLPLLGIAIFSISQTVELMTDSTSYWNHHLLNEDGELKWATVEYYERLLSLTFIEKIIFIVCRNLLVLTGSANILGSVFWIVSARNQKYEGVGRFDNFKNATIIFSLVFWVSVLYNISNIFTGAVNNFLWYNYVSWVLLHGVPQIAGVIYLIVYYQKTYVPINPKEVFVFWGKTMLPLFTYLFAFMIIGTFLNVFNALPIFGDLSGTGHFPYDFIDLFHQKGNYAAAIGLPISIGVQLLIILVFFLAMESIYFVLVYFNAKKQVQKQGFDLKTYN